MKIDREALLEDIRTGYLKRLYTDLHNHRYYRESLEQYTHVDPTKLIADADKEISRLQHYITCIESE